MDAHRCALVEGSRLMPSFNGRIRPKNCAGAAYQSVDASPLPKECPPPSFNTLDRRHTFNWPHTQLAPLLLLSKPLLQLPSSS